MIDVDDTIVAVASADGGGVRGVVRISGPRALDVTSQLSCTTSPSFPSQCARVFDTTLELGDSVERSHSLPARLFVWPGSRSYTCQPTVEIHTIGSPPLLQQVVRRAQQQGCRLAQPGEFTLRAFLAGRIDLTQAEAILGVIDAEGEASLDVALSQLAGGMARPLARLREELLMLLAELEAGLDFAEEDVRFISSEELAERLQGIVTELDQLVLQLGSRGQWHTVPLVVLAGLPNAGKSSLFNALVERFGKSAPQRALVSPDPGATRDYLTARVQLEGVEVELVDTAGVESLDSRESIAAAAQAMSQGARERATLVLQCIEAAKDRALSALDPAKGLVVLTKCDVRPSPTSSTESSLLATSAATGSGLDALAAAVAHHLQEQQASSQNAAMVPATAARCDGSLRGALEAARAAQQLAASGESEELTAHELRRAAHVLGEVAGVVASDDILDRVFRQFCIGK